MNANASIKLLVAFLAIAIIVTLFWMLDWDQKYKDIETHEATIAEKETELQEQRKLVAQLPALTARKVELEQELARVIQTNLVPEKAELFVANYIKEVEKLTTEEGYRLGDNSFEIISITPGALTSETAKSGSSSSEGEGEEGEDGQPAVLKKFPTRTFQMTMRGRYATLIEFLYQLGDLRLERLVTINKIALTPDTSDKNSGGKSPVLTIQIPITAYMREGG